jgi:acyl-CoA dehydrogenase-like protein
MALAPAPIRSPTRRLPRPHGGYGFTDEFAVSRLYRGARYGSLGGGASETLRDLVGKRLMADVSSTDRIFGFLDARVSRFECAS